MRIPGFTGELSLSNPSGYYLGHDWNSDYALGLGLAAGVVIPQRCEKQCADTCSERCNVKCPKNTTPTPPRPLAACRSICCRDGVPVLA